MTNELEQIKAAFINLQSVHEETKADYERRIAETQQQNESLKSGLACSAQLTEQIAALQADMQRVTRDNETLLKEIEMKSQLVDEFEKLKLEKESATALQRAFDKLSADYNALRAQTEALAADREQLTAIVNSLQDSDDKCKELEIR